MSYLRDLRPIIVAIISAFAAVTSAYFSVKSEKASPGSIQDGQKICLVTAPDVFSSATVVPKDWSIAHCTQLMVMMHASQMGLGCASKNGIDFGPNSKPPSKDCGWEN